MIDEIIAFLVCFGIWSVKKKLQLFSISQSLGGPIGPGLFLENYALAKTHARQIVRNMAHGKKCGNNIFCVFVFFLLLP